MFPAMVPCLAHNCLDMVQELNLILALEKWKIDLGDQICHGKNFMCCIVIDKKCGC
jgi:hypothetical protein